MYDWSDLRIFLAVAREGSTLAASRMLNMNQTTVSRRIEALEHALGLALFTRTTRGFALTPQGQALMTRTLAVEVAAIDVETEATRLTRDLSGLIRVTSPEAMMTHSVSPIMLAYRALHPEVRFESLSDEHRMNLEKGRSRHRLSCHEWQAHGRYLDRSSPAQREMGACPGTSFRRL